MFKKIFFQATIPFKKYQNKYLLYVPMPYAQRDTRK